VLEHTPSIYTVVYMFREVLVYRGAVVAVIVWELDLQLPMQSVPITTNVVGLNLDQVEVYNIM
jgi:hypothetical protein